MKMNWKMRLVLALVLMAGFVGTATLQHGGFVSTNTTRTDVLMACVGAGNPDGCSGGFYEVFKAMWGTIRSHFQSTASSPIRLA